MRTRKINRGAWARRALRHTALVALVLGTLLLPRTRATAGPIRAPRVPPCGAAQPSATAQTLPPTTVATIEEAYTCLLAHYPSGPALDDRVLLHGAMVGLITDLMRRGLDQPTAMLPALHGDHAADWRAFRAAYLAIAARLPRNPRVQQNLARATIAGLVASLQDDHTRYAAPLSVGDNKAGGASGGPAGAGEFGLGPRLSADDSVPTRTIAPLFIVAVDPGSPATAADLRPGDTITAINGLPPFVQGMADQAVLAQLDGPATLRLRIRRPATGRAMMVTLIPAPYPSPQAVTARVLPGDVAYVRLTSFVDNAANYVFAALDGLGLGPRLRGLVLDLRGNGGGPAGEPARLLGAFVHGRVFASFDDGHGHRTVARTDAGMPLVRVPLVVLIDRGCASACDVTASAIRDLRLGRLVGERTAGDVSGPAKPWFLDDGGVLQIPVAFMRGANGEIVDGVGIPPDDAAPVTATALSTGRDPGIDQALRDLQREGQDHI